MNEETGEIRDYDKLSDEERKSRKWSKPFKKGEIIELKGIRMRIIKIKQMKGQIILEAAK